MLNWHDARPNDNLPALKAMVDYASAQQWAPLDKALIYGAYAHVIMDMQAGYNTHPTVFGTGRCAEPPDARYDTDRDMLSNLEFQANFFEPTYIPQDAWTILDHYLFFRYDEGETEHWARGEFQFYSETSWLGPLGHKDWNELEFAPVSRFAEAVVATEYDVDGLTPDCLRGYLQLWGIVSFLMSGHSPDDPFAAGGPLAHPQWSAIDCRDYLLSLGEKIEGIPFRDWRLSDYGEVASLVIEIVGWVEGCEMGWGAVIWWPWGDGTPWPNHLQTEDGLDQLMLFVPDSVREWRSVKDFTSRVGSYLRYWETSAPGGEGPNWRASYANEPATARALTSELLANINGGGEYLAHEMEYDFAGRIPAREIARKAGFVGGMYGVAQGSDARQPGIICIGFREPDRAVYASPYNVYLYPGGEPQPFSLFYDIVPMTDHVLIGVVGKNSSGDSVWGFGAQWSGERYHRVTGGVPIDLMQAVSPPYNVCSLSFRVYCKNGTGEYQLMLDSDYRAAFAAQPYFRDNQLYKNLLKSDGASGVVPTRVKQLPPEGNVDENPLSNPRWLWPYVLSVTPVNMRRLSPPTSLTATSTDEGVLLSWPDESVYGDAWRVYRWNPAGNWDLLTTLARPCGSFADYDAHAGVQWYCVTAYSSLDESESEKTARTSAEVLSSYHALPELPASRHVKQGGWLTYSSFDGRVYAAPGNRCNELWAYDPTSREWSQCADMPGSRPYGGFRGVADGQGSVYAVRGTNTTDFLRYDVVSNVWGYLAPVPSGPGVKDGADLVCAEVDGIACLFLLNGRAMEFLRFNTATQEWTALAFPPNTSLWRQGSWLVWDGTNSIYAQKAKSLAMYRYDIPEGQWYGPYVGVPSRKSPGGLARLCDDGSNAVWVDGRIHAIKGNNTTEVWRGNPVPPENPTWECVEPIPDLLLRRVRYGADIASDGAALYILKGNNTSQFLRVRLPVPLAGSDGIDLAGNTRSLEASPPTDDSGETGVFTGQDAYDPRWRSDGKWVVYSRLADNGFLQVLQSRYGVQAPEVRLTSVASDCEHPVYSPDGNWVAFQMLDTVSRYWRICRVPFDTAGPQAVEVLTGGKSAERPEWSPNGKLLVYEKPDEVGRTQVFEFDVMTQVERQLTSADADHERPAFLDGDHVSMQVGAADEGYRIAVVDRTTLAVSMLTDGQDDCEAPKPSPDGAAVAFQAICDDGSYQVAWVPAAGGAVRVAQCGTHDFVEPSWSGDGYSIACVKWLDGTSQIGFVDTATAVFSPQTDGSSIRQNPDCRYDPADFSCYIAYSCEEPEPIIGGDGIDGKKRGIYVRRARRRGGDGGQGLSGTVLALERAEPNPARTGLTIHWQVPTRQPVSLRLYNTAGWLVRVLEEGERAPGRYSTRWNGLDDEGRRLAAGVYFCSLEAGDRRLSRKVVLAE